MEKLTVYNTLTKKKEVFEPLNPPHVGLYVCGPTVYGDPHLGHARSALSFDIIFRYLKFLDYKVRYVRNITDVGHLVDDADAGEDKLQKKARVEQLEPMEVAQNYTNIYHQYMDALNMLRPSIEPTASGHIIEQIEMVSEIMKNGYAYESNGSIYFDVRAYDKTFNYGELSGRNLDEMQEGYRDLEGQEEKRFPADFALWKKAPEDHIMKWSSPWGVGFPGWHIECTVMSTKYLGTRYDIHGGGMDLIFPHHEAEVAQSNACIGDVHSHELNEAKYWLHNNMITVDGKKMGKSLGNFITLEEFFTGSHERLEQAYNAMTIRFFMLQAHYGSTLDFSNEALQAAEKALKRLSDVYARLEELSEGEPNFTEVDPKLEAKLKSFRPNCTGYMNDDFNTAKVIAELFEVSPIVNEIYNSADKNIATTKETWNAFTEDFKIFFSEVLGLIPTSSEGGNSGKISDVMELLLNLRLDARKNKDYALSDKIRDELAERGITIKDTAQGTDWHVEG